MRRRRRLRRLTLWQRQRRLWQRDLRQRRLWLRDLRLLHVRKVDLTDVRVVCQSLGLPYYLPYEQLEHARRDEQLPGWGKGWGWGWG